MSPPAVGSSVAPHHGTYPSEENTTANHLPAYCDYCHDLFTEHIGFISFVPSGRRTGASTGRGWGAVVSGGSRPRVGEVVAIWLRCSGAWRDYVVTGVIDGGGAGSLTGAHAPAGSRCRGAADRHRRPRPAA